MRCGHCQTVSADEVVVGVQEQDVVAGCGGNSPVHGIGNAVVGFAGPEGELCRIEADDLQRPVGGGAVDDDVLVVPKGLGSDTFERLPDSRLGIAADSDDRDEWQDDCSTKSELRPTYHAAQITSFFLRNMFDDAHSAYPFVARSSGHRLEGRISLSVHGEALTTCSQPFVTRLLLCLRGRQVGALRYEPAAPPQVFFWGPTLPLCSGLASMECTRY